MEILTGLFDCILLCSPSQSSCLSFVRSQSNASSSESAVYPNQLQNLSILRSAIESMRQSKDSLASNSNSFIRNPLETPYVSYEDVYPSKNDPGSALSKIDEGINLTLVKQSERKFWKELVDSNIRAGTIACLWCLKAQALKKLSQAFNKWKVHTAVVNTELALVESNHYHKTEVSTVIDNAISIIKRYKDGGIMNQVNEGWSNESQEKSLNFPWEERRGERSNSAHVSSTATGGLSSNVLKYLSKVNDSSVNDSSSHLLHQSVQSLSSPPTKSSASSSFRETMETTSKEWNFIQKQFSSNQENQDNSHSHGRRTGDHQHDPESERQSLLSLSYDIIKRAEKDRIFSAKMQSVNPVTVDSPSRSSSPKRQSMTNTEGLLSTRSGSMSPTTTSSPRSPQHSHQYQQQQPRRSSAYDQQSSSETKQQSSHHQHHSNHQQYQQHHQQQSYQQTEQRQSSSHLNSSKGRFPENTLEISEIPPPPPALIAPNGPPSPFVSYDVAYPEFKLDSYYPSSKQQLQQQQSEQQQQQSSAQKRRLSSSGRKSLSSAQKQHPHHEQSLNSSTTSLLLSERKPSFSSSYGLRTGRRERERDIEERRPSSAASSLTGSRGATRSKSSSPTRGGGSKSYSQKTLVDIIKFRNTKEGDYVKDLMSPARERKETAGSFEYKEDGDEGKLFFS
jgi:hypothetical protein